MIMSAEHRSKSTVLNMEWWRLHMSEKFSNGMKNSKHTKYYIYTCTYKAVDRWEQEI